MSESISDILTQGRDNTARASKIYGLVVGLVTNIQDPEKLGRVKVKFPWLHDQVESWWARIAYPMAGKERGYWWIPEVDDEVLIGFDHGDVRFPYIVGALHNGIDKPPQTNDITGAFGGKEYDHGAYSTSNDDFNKDGKNDIRFIRSRSGHLLIFDDKNGKEKITIADKTGKHRIEIFTDKKTVVVTSEDGDIELIAGSKVKICCEEFILHSRADSTLNVDGNMKTTVKGNKTTKVNGNIEAKSDQATKHEAQTSIAVKGGQSFEVSSGIQGKVDAGVELKCHSTKSEFAADAIAIIKGGLVKIN